VCIVERGSAVGDAVVESVAPSIVPVLETLGVLGEIEHAGFARCERVRLLWSGEEEPFRQRRSAVLVDRARFDRILLDAALRSGAKLVCPARARRPVWKGSHWLVPCDTLSGPRALHATFVVDATGKRSKLPGLGAPTVALCGRWRGRGQRAPEMWVEAIEHAWIWGATPTDGSETAIVFLGTRRCAGLSAREREELYRRTLGASRLAEQPGRREPLGEIRVRDATCRVDKDPITTRSIKVGDRSVAMEPLSSQGIQAALRSGVQASFAVHTMLAGGDRDAAIDFYRNAQRETAARHRRAAAQVYASQAVHDSQFWRDRSSPETPRPAEPPLATSTSLAERVRLSPDARLAEMPVIEGELIHRRLALSHPSLEQPIAWLADHALGSLLPQIGASPSVETLLAEWAKKMPHGSARKTFDWLTERRILVPA